MAYAIGLHCTACGGCVSICPNGAIAGSMSRLWIEPLLCTECALYADEPECAACCPSGAIAPAPDVRIKAIHPRLLKAQNAKEAK